MIRSGKLPAHIDHIDPWGPTWIINEADILRLLHPHQPLVEVLSAEYEPPTQMLREVREGMTTLAILIREGDQGVRAALHQQQETWQEEMQSLRQEVHQLRADLADSHKRGRWWPWNR